MRIIQLLGLVGLVAVSNVPILFTVHSILIFYIFKQCFDDSTTNVLGNHMCLLTETTPKLAVRALNCYMNTILFDLFSV